MQKFPLLSTALVFCAALASACVFTVSITSPPSGTTYTTAQTVTISASVVDNDTVAKTEFYDGAALKSTDTVTPYTYDWSFTSADNGTHSWTAKAYDSSGNVTSPAVNLIVNIATGNGGATANAQRYGSTGQDYGQAAVVDSAGNEIVTGYYAGSVNFGGGVLPCTNSSNIFLAKYSSAGSFIWAKCFAGTGNGAGQALTLDPAGNILITGYFGGTLNFGGGNLTSVGGYDIFVAKYTAAGDYVWANRYGSTYTGDGFGPEAGLGIASDASGNVGVAGRFYSTVDFGDGPRTSAGGSDIYLLQLTSAGAFTRVFTGGSTSTTSGEQASGIAFDTTGALYATGAFLGTMNFGCGSLVNSNSDIFLVKFSGGTCVWANKYGGTSNDAGQALAIDTSNNVILGGVFQGTANFGCGNLVSIGGDDVFLAKFNSAGTCQWSKRAGGNYVFPGFDALKGVALDSADNIAIAGWFSNTADFDGTQLVSAGSTDAYAAKYLANGTLSWAKRFGGANIDEGWGVGVNGVSNVVVTGRFLGTVDFGTGPLTSAGQSDIFVLSLVP